MRLRWIILLVLLGVIVVALVAAHRRSEPMLHGKPLTYWLEPGRQHPKEPPEAIAAVFAEMDEDCVRFLIRELEWTPSPLVPILNAPLSRLSIVLFQDRPDHRALAASTLAKLGPRAMCAVPALEKLARDGVEPRAADARGAAIAALVMLRQDPLNPLIEKLRDPSSPDQHACASALCHLGTNAAPVVPLLVNVLETSTNEWVKTSTMRALVAIRTQPELSVPALASLLTQTNVHLRWFAIFGLGYFEAEAKPAWDTLVRCLNDPEMNLRHQTSNSLRKIDPEAARQLGIN
jgi:hypothetical protein